MKYWLLTTEYPPFHGGGISTYCFFTASMLAAAGMEVTVFVPDDSVGDYSILSQKIGIQVIRFNSNRSQLHQALGYTSRLSYEFAQIVRILIREQGYPDYIESQDYLGIAYYLQQFKLLQYEGLQHIPIIITLHSPAFIYLEYNRAPTYKFPDFHTCEMEKYSIKAADVLISPTIFLAEEISRYITISNKQIHFIPNPYQAAITEDIPAFKKNKILYYGKLSPQKGTFELLEYFKELWDNGFAHSLHFIGGTDIVYYPDMLTMGQIVKERYDLYIKRGLLLLHDKISPSEINNALSDAHVIIVPSIVDNLPYVVMEAMHLGKVVLASVQGGQREMIEDGENGFLFDHRREGSFSDRLFHILKMKEEEVIALGKKAQERVLITYNFKKIFEQKKALLDSLKGENFELREYPFLYQEPTSPAIFSDTNELLSVIIPYYNMGKFIEDCILSVLGSTYMASEILVINDGSTDAYSLEQLEKIKTLDNKVRVINQKNKGLAATRNEGARLAKGYFLAFLDADDKVAPDYYDKAVTLLKRYGNVFFVGSWVQYFENSRNKWVTFTPQPPYILVHNSMNSSGLVYKRAAFLQAGLNDKNVDYGLEDYESVLSLMAAGYNGVVLPEFLFFYRVRSDSMFRKITRQKILYSYKYISQKHGAYYAKFASDVVNLLNANGPGFLFDNPTFEVAVHSKQESNRWLLTRVKAFVKRNELLKKIALKIVKKSL
ncbi:MAG TPA: glycosyltransferase [Puia sp.]